MSKHAMHNVIVKATDNGTTSGFDIVLVFSGIPETVTHHAHDGMLHQLLRDGIRLDDLRRWRVQTTWNRSAPMPRRTSRKFERAVSRLLANIDRYLGARTAMLAPFSDQPI